MTIQNILVTQEKELNHFLNKALLEEYNGFDIEAVSLDHTSSLAGFSLFLPSQSIAIYVALNHGSHQLALTSDQILKISQLKVKTYNGGFDLYRWEYRYGTRPTCVGDAGVVSKLLQLHKFGLKNLAEELKLTTQIIRIEDVLGAGKYDFTKAPLNNLTRDYGCQDAILACLGEEALLKNHFKPAHHPGWDRVYSLELAVMPILERASCEGILVDRAKFEEAAELMKEEALSLSYEICRDLNRGSSFPLGSPKRLAAALYNPSTGLPNKSAKTEAQREMTLPGLGLTPPGNTSSTATSVLELIEDQHPVITKILRWKKLNSVITRDLDQMMEFAKTGILHPQFIQIGEDGTSRIYSRQPNLISMSMEARRAMPPRKNRVYIHADFDAAEWRIVALLSGEQKVLDSLEEGIDPHYFTYSEMTGKPVSEVSREEREIGKVLNYACLYGANPYRVSLDLQISQTQAAMLLDEFWNTYPRIKAWVENRKIYCKEHARTYTVLGRTRYLPEAFSKDPSQRASAARQSVNTAGQGSCGDALKLALVKLDSASRDPNSILNKYNLSIRCPVFDAVLLELDAEAMEQPWEVEKEILHYMEVELTYEGRSTKMKAHVGWSQVSWADACGKGESLVKRNETPDPNRLKNYEIWVEGNETETASLQGKAFARSFEEACKVLAEADAIFNLGFEPQKTTFMGRRLLDNELEARVSFG
jgi:DNA polymerase I-like protein with 3'-5' exonuclease and polymerase domains